MAAKRARDSRVEWVTDPLDLAAPSEPAAQAYTHPSDVDQQVAQAVLEARVLASTFERLSRQSRPSFAWRCIGVAQALAAALDKFFEGVR